MLASRFKFSPFPATSSVIRSRTATASLSSLFGTSREWFRMDALLCHATGPFYPWLTAGEKIAPPISLPPPPPTPLAIACKRLSLGSTSHPSRSPGTAGAANTSVGWGTATGEQGTALEQVLAAMTCFPPTRVLMRQTNLAGTGPSLTLCLRSATLSQPSARVTLQLAAALHQR